MNTATHEAAGGSRKLDRLLAHYGESHRHPTNELIHFIAIPAIMLSLIGLIFWIHPWAAYAFLAISMVYYVHLGSGVVMAAMAAWAAASLALVHAMGAMVLPLSAGIFVVAWIFQFIGHKVEGRKPSFFEDLQYLLVGPIFVLTRLLEKLSIRW